MLDSYTLVILISDKSCPGGKNPCNGHGQCIHNSGVCICETGRTGSDCSGEFWTKLEVFF